MYSSQPTLAIMCEIFSAVSIRKKIIINIVSFITQALMDKLRCVFLCDIKYILDRLSHFITKHC